MNTPLRLPASFDLPNYSPGFSIPKQRVAGGAGAVPLSSAPRACPPAAARKFSGEVTDPGGGTAGPAPGYWGGQFGDLHPSRFVHLMKVLLGGEKKKWKYVKNEYTVMNIKQNPNKELRGKAMLCAEKSTHSVCPHPGQTRTRQNPGYCSSRDCTENLFRELKYGK